MSEKTNITNLNLNVDVECVDISRVIHSIDGDIQVLKMDVEGAEYEILERILETESYKKIKSIYFEDHSRKMSSSNFHQLKDRILREYKNKNIDLYWW